MQLKDLENQKLKSELNNLKYATDKVNNNVFKQGNFTLGDINLQMGGMMANNRRTPFDLFLPGNEFFCQNETRNVDLDNEERSLLHVNAHEMDHLRILSQIPIGTELYRFKMEQFKDLSSVRIEMEKVIQEQRLQKLKRNFERQRRHEDRWYDNEKWIDDHRKFIIGARIRKEGKPITEDYDLNSGFIVHWDFDLGLPKDSRTCQTVFGIYCNGETVLSQKLVESTDCEVESQDFNRTINAQKHHIFDVPPNKNTLMIMEVQTNGPDGMVSYGWTQIDLFDEKGKLKFFFFIKKKKLLNYNKYFFIFSIMAFSSNFLIFNFFKKLKFLLFDFIILQK